ncbi:Glucan endo-1,3-beta-D-glucosidase [Acorus calamus]|uniref:Glucan endo-1,3-beta-D-glucosidase n=1 Tax=Acorus calamus TaxID=4465 RepID=A0AAV9CRK0_ACOCL|nr:Glucan endo-1,3-beta-D-glucosidase [Acorus calamus]
MFFSSLLGVQEEKEEGRSQRRSGTEEEEEMPSPPPQEEELDVDLDDDGHGEEVQGCTRRRRRRRGRVKGRNFMRGKNWCVAKASSDETSLQDNLNYACTQVDCSVINAGGSCFEPNLLISHASVAMNLYYQSMGRNVWNCDFTHSGLITISDPSYGTCSYAYGS